MEKFLLPLAELPQRVGHRYLPTERFAELSALRLERGRIGTPLAIENYDSLPVQAGEIDSLTQALDEAIARIDVAEDIRLVFVVGANSPARAFKLGLSYCIAIDIILGHRCFVMAVAAYHSGPYIDFQRFSASEPKRVARWNLEGAPHFKSFDDVPVLDAVKEEQHYLPCYSYAGVMLWAIVAHELAHIVNGHLSLVDVMSENDMSPQLDAVTVRTLEFDADSAAVLWSLNQFPTIRPFAASPEKDKHFVLSDFSLRLIFLTQLAWRIIEYGDPRPLDENTSTHFDGGRRSAHIPAVVLSIVAREAQHWSAKADLDYCAKQLRDLVGLLEQIHRVTFSTEPSAMERFIADNPESDPAVGKVFKRWAEIRPILLKSKLGSHNLAPAQV